MAAKKRQRVRVDKGNAMPILTISCVSGASLNCSDARLIPQGFSTGRALLHQHQSLPYDSLAIAKFVSASRIRNYELSNPFRIKLRPPDMRLKKQILSRSACIGLQVDVRRNDIADIVGSLTMSPGIAL